MTTSTATRPCPAELAAASPSWPLERVLFAMAGTMVLLASLLTLLISPWFVLIAVFVGINQWLYVAFGGCLASVILKRVFGLRAGATR